MNSAIINKEKQDFWQFYFTNFPPNIADLAQQKLYINANLYGTQATVCSMYYCRVKCKKAQPDFAQFSSTAFNIFRAYEKYSDKNEVAAGNENPIVNMLILEMKVALNNSISIKMRETISNFRFQLRRKNEKLISCTKDIRRKLRTTQSQLHLLVDERAELTAKVSNVLPTSTYINQP